MRRSASARSSIGAEATLPRPVPFPARLAAALAAFPAGWAVREAAGGAGGGVVVLALVLVAGWPRAGLVGAGLACFAGVHLVAAATSVYAGLAVGALVFAAITSRAWRSSSSARRATPAS